jgi:opacity protein-like surface antigen
MKMTKWFVYGTLGTCSVLAALVAQPVQAAEQKAYFTMDAGLALVQDLEIKEVGGLKLPFTGSAAGLGDVLGVSIPSTASITIDKPKFSMSPGLRVDMIAGYNVAETIALEFEGGLLYNGFDKIKVSGSAGGVPFSKEEKVDDLNLWQVPVFLNGVYTFKLDSKFKPFLGAGVGGVFTLIQGAGDSENDFTLAFQGMAGVKYEISESMNIGVTYKFLGSLDHDFTGVKTDGIYSHSFLAAFTFKY